MVGQGKGSARAVGVLAEHRDVLALVHFLKAKFLQRPNDRRLGASTGNLGMGFGYECLQHGCLRIQDLRAESLDVEANGRFLSARLTRIKTFISSMFEHC